MISRISALLILFALVLITRIYPETSADGLESGMAVSLGLVIIAGYLLGEIGARFALPKITGYILTGIALGPYAFEFLSFNDVKSFTLIDKIALSLIALTAGGEFRIDAVKQRIRGILWITFFQTIFLLGFMTALFRLFSPWIPFVTDSSYISQWGAAIVFGVIAVCRSPATLIAIITETKSKGPVTDTCLGITVIIDVVVILLFSTLLPLIKVLEFDSGFEWSFLFHLTYEFLLSIVAGIAAGYGISFYLRYVQKSPVLFILAFSFLASEASLALHLDTLIVCLTAGVWVTNASRQGKELIKMIEESSLIIYVLFFSITGAKLNLDALYSMFGLAVLLSVCRLLFLWLSTTTGAKISGDSFPSLKTLWMLFIPQAGVCLGLVVILQREGVTWGAGMQTLVVAIVALNQIVGPILMKYALYCNGETGKAAKRATRAAGNGGGQ